jgi:hypothetical protein
MLELFFSEKSQQLVFYVSRYLRGQLPHQEIHLFIWDTLEEWAQLQILNHTPANQQEQVFWHLLHQLEYWSETELKQDRLLRKKLQYCVGFLQGKAEIPFECIGIRP